jgi:hypothetical protein
MNLTVRHWAKNHNAVSVDRGPLSFSLRIGEKWQTYGTNNNWPESEVFPTTAWNYGLVLDPEDPAKSFEVVKKPGPLAQQPFTPETAPIELRAKARKIPAWKLDQFGLVGKLQAGPVKTDEPIETVSLIPMGAARLRISSFPVAGTGTKAHEWVASQASPVSASHCFASDSVEALIDGLEPKNSNDHDIPRFTWWDHRGTAEWVQYDFEKPQMVSAVGVYWFDDTGAGNCRAPKSWRLFYQEGEKWKPVETSSSFGTKVDTYNLVEFKSIKTSGLRLEVQLAPKFSAGILEWKISPSPQL